MFCHRIASLEFMMARSKQRMLAHSNGIIVCRSQITQKCVRVLGAPSRRRLTSCDAVAVVQGLSKEATRLPGIVVVAFSCAVSFCGLYSVSSWQPWKPVQFAGNGNYIS